MAMFALESSALDGRLMKKAVCKVNSLPKTKICRLKIGRLPQKERLVFQPSIFRGELFFFREAIDSKRLLLTQPMAKL